MDKKILNIKMTFADGLLPDKSRDENAIRNMNNWLAPLINELHDENVTAEIHIDEGGVQHLTFSKNISNELFNKVQIELEKYQYRLTGLWSGSSKS